MPPKKNSVAPSQSPPQKKGVGKIIKPKKQGGKKAYDANDFDTWTVPQLKAECKSRKLKVGGRRPSLIDRLRINDETKAEAEKDEEDEEEDGEEAVEDHPAVIEKEVERTAEAEAEPAVAEATTPEAEPTPTPEAGKEIKVPGSKKATMSEPYVEQKSAGGVQTFRKPAKRETKPLGLGSDGRPITYRKPKRGAVSSGKPWPTNGYKATALSLPPSPPPAPGLKHKGVDIERAKDYREALMNIVEQIREENGDADTIFSEAVQHLGAARNELSRIAKAEVESEVEEALEVEDDEGLVGSNQEVQENVEDPEDEDFSDGSDEWRKRGRDDAEEDEGNGEDVNSPPRKRGKASTSSEESEEE